jgi:hypothetical protein
MASRQRMPHAAARGLPPVTDIATPLTISEEDVPHPTSFGTRRFGHALDGPAVPQNAPAQELLGEWVRSRTHSDTGAIRTHHRRRGAVH